MHALETAELPRTRVRLVVHCERARAEGFELRPRLPIYPEYVDDEFVDPAMRSVIERATDETAGGNEPAGAMA